MERSWVIAAVFWAFLVNCGCVIKAELSSHRLCANEKCDEPVSVGIALQRYFPTEKGMISLQPNDQVTIYSHPAGSNPNLLGVEVNGVRGYVPRHAIRETKMKKWAKDMVEVEPWLRNPSAGHKRPLRPPQSPYSPEWVQGSGQLRPRPSDWYHKHMHSLRQRLQNQQQPTAQTGAPPPQPAKTDPPHQPAPPPAAQPLQEQLPAAAGLDASGGHKALFGSPDGAAAATPESAQVEPAPAGQPVAATAGNLPPTQRETATAQGGDPPSAQAPGEDAHVKTQELGNQPAAAPQAASETQPTASANERQSEHESRDAAAPVEDTPESRTEDVSPHYPPGGAEEATSTSQLPEPAAGTGEAGQMAAPLQDRTAGSTLNDVDRENDTSTDAPPLPDPLVLPNAAVVAEQADMSVHSTLPNEIPVPNQPVLPNQPILPGQPVTADQPVMSFNATGQDQPVVPTPPTADQAAVPTQPTPDQPAIAVQPTPDQPEVTVQPTPDQPVVPTQPTPDQPAVAVQPTPDQPVVPTQPTPDQPVVPTQPTPDQPAVAVQPTEGQPPFVGSQWPAMSEEAAAAAAALGVDLPQPETEQPSPPSAEQTPDQPATGASEPDVSGGAAETEPAQPAVSGEPGTGAEHDPAPGSGLMTGPASQPEPAAATPAEQYAVPETDTIYTPPDDSAAHQAAFSESAYGDSAYGKSAYGESAYGKSAYGESVYGESAYSTGHEQAVETPSLAEEAAAGMLPAWLWSAVEGVLPSGGGSSDGSLRLSVLLSTVGVALAVLFIGMRLVSQLRGESALKQTISKLHQRLTVRQEEITVFKTQLETASKEAQETGSAARLQAALQAAAADQAAAEEELEEARHQTSELGAQVAALEQELAQAQLLLEEQMAQQSQPSSPPIDSVVVETVAKLDAELKQQRKKLMGEMDKLKREKKRLAEELSHTKPMLKQLEAKLASIGDNKISAEEEERSRKQIEELTQRQTKLTQQCADLTSERDASAEKVSELESEAAAARQQQQAARDQMETLQSELDALRTTLKSLEQSSENGSEAKIQDLLEGSKLKGQVEKLTKERAKLKEKWKQERELLRKAQASVEEKSSELTQLSERCEKAEVDKFEAESKLDHLEKYFQKKEVSFQEEIGVLKSRLSLTEGDNTSSHDLVQRLTEEVAQYKTMTDTLKQEIQDQERSFRSQIQALEKRSHESWVTCRQAERRLEEANREAAQYRALLTKTEEEKHNLVNGQAVLQSFNGTGAVSPVPDVSQDPLLSGAPFLPAPPPPLDPFLPPPPPLSDPFLPAPLPPLPPPDGRYDDYSPGARYRDGADSPLSERSERGYASSGRRGAGRDWSPPRMSRSSYSPERLSERGLSPERGRRAPLPRYVGGHGSDASGPKTSSPLVADDYERPPQDKRKPNYPRI